MGRLIVFALVCLVANSAWPAKPLVLATDDSAGYCLKLSNRPLYRFIHLKSGGLWFGQTEVTFALAEATVMPHTKYDYYRTLTDFSTEWPIFNLTSADALAICAYLNKHTTNLPPRLKFRLPTATEWTHAATAGGHARYPWGDQWPPAKMEDGIYPNLYGTDAAPASFIPNFYRDFKPIPSYTDGYYAWCPVYKSGRNKFNLYGLAGNVEEWCLDDTAPDPATYVVMGGSWMTPFPNTLTCTHKRILKPHPSFIPGVPDRPSSNVFGMRLVLADQ